jgi:hypothetical protein
MAKKSDPHWIEHSHMEKGKLRRELHTPAGKDITQKKLETAAHSKNADVRKDAIRAETLEKLRKK